MSIERYEPRTIEPHVEYEAALLGACLSGYRDIDSVSAILKASDFDKVAHETVWEAIVATAQTEKNVNALTVMHTMGKTAHKLPGGATFLTDLAGSGSFVAANAVWYAEQIIEASAKRAAVEIGIRLQQASMTDMQASDLRDLAIEHLQRLTVRQSSTWTTPSASLPEVLRIAEEGRHGSIPTRWHDLNDVVDGWYPEQLITIGARPGVGKSLWAGNSAVDAAKRGHKVYLVSLEMSSVELTQRQVSEMCNVDLKRLRTGRTTQTEFEAIQSRFQQINELPIRHADRPSQTLADIRAGAREMQRETGCDMVIVDYVGLIAPRDPKLDRHLQIGEITRGLKQLARELKVPVLQLAQLRRPQNPKQLPTMSDLKESGDLEQDSDVVILLHWDIDTPQEVVAIVEKQRSGPTGFQVKLLRRGNHARLDSATDTIERTA